jgi:hypothetical protein
MNTKQIKMTPAQWAKIKPNPQQRDTEKHARKAIKSHLKEFSATHARVAMAELPNGARYKLDGHTRDWLWQTDALEPPKTLFCDVYYVKNALAAMELYEHFDNTQAVETAGDKISGAFRYFNIPKESALWNLGGTTTSLKTLYTNRQSGMAKIDIKLCVEPFVKDLAFIDSANYAHINFPAPVFTALLMTVHKDGNSALSFWDAYNHDEGKKNKKSMDAVYALTDSIRTMRERGEFTRGSRRAVTECVPKLLAIYEKWGSLLRSSPKAGGDFRYYVEQYCGDIMDKLRWNAEKGSPQLSFFKETGE